MLESSKIIDFFIHQDKAGGCVLCLSGAQACMVVFWLVSVVSFALLILDKETNNKTSNHRSLPLSNPSFSKKFERWYFLFYLSIEPIRLVAEKFLAAEGLQFTKWYELKIVFF